MCARAMPSEARPPERGDDEFSVIARFFAPLAATEPGAFGLTDDAAALTPPAGCDLIVTCDTIVEGVHFLPDDPADSVAAKVLAVNLSDLAAMGATPAAYLLSAALPTAWERDRRFAWLAGFSDGLDVAQRGYGVSLIGGDTVASPDRLSLTVTAIGWVAVGRALRRAGARVGDLIFVSGTIGDAGLGLKLLAGDERMGVAPEIVDALIDRYRRPQARTALGPRLVGLASAAIDVSDGFVADLGHICQQSRVGAVIYLADVPVSAAARAIVGDHERQRAELLSLGDDYEILFTTPPERGDDVLALAAELTLPIHPVGVITAADSAEGLVRVLARDGSCIRFEHGGYRHF
jgi:thiamine-monophosphate kinase